MPDQSIDAPRLDQNELQRVVLDEVLHLFPLQPTLRELVRSLNRDPDDFGQNDSINVSVRDLSGAGLLRLRGDAVAPTRAALRANELWGIVVS